MIHFSDITIDEGKGHFSTITAIMRDQDGVFDWMLKSNATVAPQDLLGNPGFPSNFTLHFWSHGEVCISETTHPTIAEAPYDDIIELKQWCVDHGWKKLSVRRELIESPQGFEFWMRMYIAGMVDSDELKQHEEDEMNRLIKAQEIEEQDDANQEEINLPKI